jgi:soluble lytic murein transglycosylase-like protein
MQVLPSTNREISQPRGGRSYDLTDPAQNIEAGMQYLELMYELTDGDAEKILAGYYQGLRSVRKNGRYESTEKYIANILALWDRFEANG